MVEAQTRVVGLVERLRRKHPDGRVVLVSHADVIRALLLHGLGLPLDQFLRIEVEPGSVSVLQVEDWGARLLRLNDTGEPV
jgi:probable phosphoglycerate mutase